MRKSTVYRLIASQQYRADYHKRYFPNKEERKRRTERRLLERKFILAVQYYKPSTKEAYAAYFLALRGDKPKTIEPYKFTI